MTKRIGIIVLVLGIFSFFISFVFIYIGREIDPVTGWRVSTDLGNFGSILLFISIGFMFIGFITATIGMLSELGKDVGDYLETEEGRSVAREVIGVLKDRREKQNDPLGLKKRRKQ